jgi:hypothetical protein
VDRPVWTIHPKPLTIINIREIPKKNYDFYTKVGFSGFFFNYPPTQKIQWVWVSGLWVPTLPAVNRGGNDKYFNS